jgi:hypothetical protein
MKKTLISTVLRLLYFFLFVKNNVNITSKRNFFCRRLENHWEEVTTDGSVDPDPQPEKYQNVTDPEHCFKSVLFLNKYLGNNEDTHLDLLGNILSGQHGGVGRGLVTVGLHLHATGHPIKWVKKTLSTMLKSKKSLLSGSGMFNSDPGYNSRIRKILDPAPASVVTPKIVTKLSKIYSGIFISDPDTGSLIFLTIPNPGSATLL